jgi:hypothetical protein
MTNNRFVEKKEETLLFTDYFFCKESKRKIVDMGLI